MSIEFPMDAKVRFTQQRLAILTPRDRQGLAGRIGVVQTDGHLVRKPTVYFAAEGTKVELRLFRVDPRHLELVESPAAAAAEPESVPRLDGGASQPDLPAAAADLPASAPDGGGNLSQSDMDNFFD